MAATGGSGVFDPWGVFWGEPRRTCLAGVSPATDAWLLAFEDARVVGR